MESRRMNVLISCSISVVFLFLLNWQMSEGYRIHEDTEAAMEEMTNLFRSLFPLVPEQTHFFWKTNQLGAATVQRSAQFKEEEPDGGGRGMFPWRLQIDFRKRGPDCMRKCITQGVLHPVQCHSLC